MITEDVYMTTGEAFEIVYELARSNALDILRAEPELVKEARKQQVALDVVHDFLVNNIYE